MLTVKRLKNIAKVYPYLKSLVAELAEAHACYAAEIEIRKGVKRRAEGVLAKHITVCNMHMRGVSDLPADVRKLLEGSETDDYLIKNTRVLMKTLAEKQELYTLKMAIRDVDIKLGVWLKYLRFSKENLNAEFAKSTLLLDRINHFYSNNRPFTSKLHHAHESTRVALGANILLEQFYSFVNEDPELNKIVADAVGTTRGWRIVSEVTDITKVEHVIQIGTEDLRFNGSVPFTIVLKEALAQGTHDPYVECIYTNDAYKKNAKGADGKYIQPKRSISYPQFSVFVTDNSKEVPHEEHQKD